LGVSRAGDHRLGDLIFLLNDLRAEFRRTGRTINQHLPEILEKTRTSTETLAQLSADIRQGGSG
jgi:hypothetical protein